MEPVRTIAQFFAEIKDSLEEQAKRKGYNDSGADGRNQLYEFCVSVAAEPGHTVGECIYKLTEFMSEPREVLPIKVGAWMFLLWKKTAELRGLRGLPSETESE